MDMAANGTPIVKIATPNANGTSYNQYNQFNVDQRGLILNNSNQITTTQLAGYIDGNGNLKTSGPASLIINEVVGNNVSNLNGYIEIAGAKADLILANPYGISCVGCGFINTPDVTLAAAKPVIGADGKVSSYTITNGALSVGGSGLDASRARLNLFARAITLNAGVWADKINASYGAGEVKAENGEIVVVANSAAQANQPAFGFDVAALGGMYAGAIRLVGTEAGLGVNVAGNLAGLEQGVSLSADGKVNVGGSITAKTDVMFQTSGSLDVGGQLYADGKTNIISGGLTGNGLIASGGDVSIKTGSAHSGTTIAAGLARDGTLTQAGNLTLSSTGALSLGGDVLAHDKLDLTASDIALGGNIRASRITASANSITNSGELRSSGAVDLTGALSNDGVIQGQVVTLKGGSLSNNGGVIDAQAGLTANATSIENIDGIIQSATALSLTGASLNNDGGAIYALGTNGLSLDINGVLSSQNGQIGGNGDVRLKAASLSLRGADANIIAAKALTIDTKADLSAMVGAGIASGEALTLGVGGNLVADSGRLESGAALTVKADTVNLTGTSAVVGTSVDIAANQNLANSGTILASSNTGVLKLDAGSAFTNGGTVQSNGDGLTINAASAHNSGKIALAGTGALNLAASGAVANSGSILSNGSLTLSGGALTNSGTLSSAKAQSVTVDGALSNRGVISSGDALTLQAASIMAHDARFEAAGPLALSAHDMALGNAQISAVGSGALTLSASGAITANGATIGGNGNVALSGTSLTLGTSDVTALGTLDLNASQGDISLGADGLFAASGNVTVQAAGTLNAASATIASDNAVNLTAGGIILDDGVLQGDTLTLTSPNLSLIRTKLRQTGAEDFSLSTSGAVDYSGGELYVAGKNFTLSAGSITNVGGQILHAGTGTMAISTGGTLNNQGGVLATNGGLVLSAASLNNINGSVTANGAANLTLDGALNNDGGFIASGNGLTQKAGNISNQGGALETTGALKVDAASLSGGNQRIVASGTGADLAMTISGAINASASDLQTLIGSTGSASIKAGSIALSKEARLTAGSALNVTATSGNIDLSGGIVDGASISLDVANGAVSTGTGGLILTPGALAIDAQTLNLEGGAAQGTNVTLRGTDFVNNGGTLQALGALDAQLNGAIQNQNGEIFAAGDALVKAASLNNHAGGLTHGGTGSLHVQISGDVDNSNKGLIATNGTLALGTGSLTNDGGQIATALGGSITSTGALSNLGGVVQSDKALALKAGSIANDGGIIDSLDALTVYAPSITNGGGSIVARGGNGLTIDGPSLALTNGSGIIGSAVALKINADSIINQGSIQAQSADIGFNSFTNSGTLYASPLTLNGGTLVNTSGEIGSNGAITATLTSLDNRSGTIAAGIDGLTLTSDSLLNDEGKLGSDGDVTLTVGNFDNGTGAIAAKRDLAIVGTSFSNAAGGAVWADRNAVITSSGIFTNRGSVAAANDLTVNAGALDNGAGSDVGTIAAGRLLTLGFTDADFGKLVTGSDLTLNTNGDYTNKAGSDLSVVGVLTFNVGGNFINEGKLEGGTALSVTTTGNLTNQATAKLTSNALNLNAGDTISNAGLINGGTVKLSANNIVNNARIYGDQLTLSGANAITNLGGDAVIASRGGLLALESNGTITNQDGAYLYALGDLKIGGVGGTGSAASLINSSATIQSQGNMQLAADTISNIRTVFTWDDVVTNTHVPDHIVYPTRPGYKKTELRYDETRTETTITGDSGEARIIAGGSIGITTNSLYNAYSTIAAGGALYVNGAGADDGIATGSVSNTSLTGRVIIDRTGRYRSTKDGIIGNVHKSDPYSFHSQADTFTVPSIISAGGSVTIDAKTIDNVVLSAQGGSAVDYAKRLDGVTRGNIGEAQAPAPVTGVSALSAGGGVTGQAIEAVDNLTAMPAASGVTGAPLTLAEAQDFGLTLGPVTGQQFGAGGNLTLNLGGLFNYADPSKNYLVETDSNFTNYGSFLSSDYFLGKLGFDPSRVQKRMGDALYEQQLITNQLVREAGVGRLADYGDNEAQYKALMDAGLTVMKSFNLALGVGLTAEQMATLTSNIVLLVEVTVQTPQGPQKVLTPKVYLTQISQRDLTSGGAIITGSDVQLRAADTLTNAGVIRASNSSAILGNDVLNSGRLDLGSRGMVAASNDLINRGGTITGGDLTLSAGRDLSIEAAVTTVRTATTWSMKGNKGTQTTETLTNQSSLVDATGNVNLVAGRDLTIKGSTVNAGGILTGSAQTINIVGAIDSANVVHDSVRKSGGFLSSKKTTTHSDITDQNVVSSTLSGDKVILNSKGDTNILGSNVVATNGVDISAGGNLTVGTIAATDSSDELVKVKKVGLSLSGTSLFAGVAKNSTDTQVTSVTNTGSLIGSEHGNVILSSDKALSVTGSQVVGSETVALLGQSVNIQNATDVTDTNTVSKSSSFGVTVGINNAVLNAALTAKDMAGIVGNDQANDRTKAVAGLTGGLATYNGVDMAGKALGEAGGDPLKALDASTSLSVTVGMSKSKSTTATHDETILASQVSGKDVIIAASGAGADSTINVAGSNVDATNNLTLAAEGAITLQSAKESDTMTSRNTSSGVSVGVDIQAGAITPKASANFGKGSASGTDVTHIESNLTAGGTATITTPDALTMRGATVTGDKVAIDGASLSIESEQDKSTYNSKQTNIGLSVSMANGGSISGNFGRDKQSGDFASVQEQSGIYAGAGGFNVNVTGATDLKGAVIASTADPSRNSLTTGTLTASDIENRERYKASSMNIGAGISGIGGSGDGTNGVNTDRDGKATTTNTPGTSLPGIKTGMGTISATPPVAMGAHGSQSGTTYSAISPGTIAITSGDAASQSVAATISRDTAAANDGALTRAFDDAKREEIALGFAATRALANETATFFANRAKDQEDAEKKAIAAGVESNPDGTYKRDENGNLVALNPQAQAFINEASGLRKDFGAGSPARIIATAFNGAAGSNVTGSMSGLVQSAAVNVLQSLAVSEVKKIADSLGADANRDGRLDKPTATTESVRAALQALTGCAGAAAGGSGSCGSAAMGAASSVVINYLLTSFVDADPKDANGNPIPRSLEDQEARKNIVTTIIAGIATASGITDTNAATIAAQIETENNDLKRIKGVNGEERLKCTAGEAECINAMPFEQWKDADQDSSNYHAYREVRGVLGLQASEEQILDLLRLIYWSEIPFDQALVYVRDRGYSWQEAATVYEQNKANGISSVYDPLHTDNWQAYTIQSSDNSLLELAESRGYRLHDILAANPTIDPNNLVPGQQIRMPSQQYIDDGNYAKLIFVRTSHWIQTHSGSVAEMPFMQDLPSFPGEEAAVDALDAPSNALAMAYVVGRNREQINIIIAQTNGDAETRITEADPASSALDTVMLNRGSTGDWNKIANNPQPSTIYQFDNGYTYTTDTAGRVTTVQADLKLDPWDRNGYQQLKAGGDCRTETDCGGHLIAAMFGGPGEGVNLVAMDKTLNGQGGGFYLLEQEWRKGLLKAPPDNIKVSVEPIYNNGGKRPSDFIVRQTVNGKTMPPVVLKNGHK